MPRDLSPAIQDLCQARDQLNRFIVRSYESLGADHPARVKAAAARDEIVAALKAIRES